jgi:hypothetical protein
LLSPATTSLHSRALQAPIKLLFPKNFSAAEAGKNFSMLGAACALKAACVQLESFSRTQMQPKMSSLCFTPSHPGLGDIVIPGIFLALLLRFDAIHKTRTYERAKKLRMQILTKIPPRFASVDYHPDAPLNPHECTGSSAPGSATLPP